MKEIWSTITYCTKEQNLGSTAGATAVLRYPAILLPGALVPPGLLVSPSSGLPVFFVFCLWCCSESEDSVNNSRIQHSNCLWFCATFSPFVLEFLSGIVALHPVFQQFVPAHLANVQALPVKQILFCGAMVPTLLPVRPGPHLIDAGLL